MNEYNSKLRDQLFRTGRELDVFSLAAEMKRSILKEDEKTLLQQGQQGEDVGKRRVCVTRDITYLYAVQNQLDRIGEDIQELYNFIDASIAEDHARKTSQVIDNATEKF